MAKWKPILNHPNYEVNRMGQIRNKRTGKVLKPYDDGNGYLRVKIDGKCERVHILVATAFIPNPENKPVVNHKKGKKHDCRASQLEWVTQSENIKHAWDFGLFQSRGGGKTEWQRKRTLKTGSKNGLNPLVSIPLVLLMTR
ncbi:hypothetical protein DXC23_00995 [Eubacterium sp. OM08-24]|nr:hypothetical protein DXC23_00995 [Eubacterium sp. OM08-24]